MKPKLHRLVAIPPGGRLDHVLASNIPGESRSRIQNLIRSGRAEVDGIVILKTGYALSGGETIVLEIPAGEPTALEPEDIPLDIVYEDKNVIVINKAAGIVVHPSAGHTTGTLVHGVLGHAPDLPGIGGEKRPGVVHRLDKDTSGLIVFAKNDASLAYLQQQFKGRTIEKTYIGLVDGGPPTPSGRIEAPIGRDPRERKRMAVVSENRGRAAVSLYHTEERFQAHTLLKVRILTGRTHQIRVHMAFLGCPVAGDRVYGRRKPSIELSRQFLHASALAIQLPDEEEPRTFHAPLPEDLEMVLAALRGQR